MKTLSSIFLISILISFQARSQPKNLADSVKSYLQVAREIIDAVDEVQESISTSTITMQQGICPIHINNRTLYADSILSVEMEVIDGYINSIDVTIDGLIYSNQQAPIGITRRRLNNNRANDALYNKLGEYIYLSDVINSKIEKSYIPDDGDLKLTKNKPVVNLKKNVGINSMLDIRFYTDILGLTSAEQNPLAQTDIKFRQILHRRNITNTGLFLLHDFRLSGSGAKTDSKSKFVDSLDFSRNKLIQQTSFKSELICNLIGGFLFEKKSSNLWYVDAGVGIYNGRFSKHSDTITANIMLPYYFFETGINFKVAENLGGNICGRYSLHYIPENIFTIDRTNREFYSVIAEIFYNPIKNRANRMFLRASTNFTTEVSDEKNNFYTIQFGYSLTVTKLINSIKK